MNIDLRFLAFGPDFRSPRHEERFTIFRFEIKRVYFGETILWLNLNVEGFLQMEIPDGTGEKERVGGDGENFVAPLDCGLMHQAGEWWVLDVEKGSGVEALFGSEPFQFEACVADGVRSKRGFFDRKTGGKMEL